MFSKCIESTETCQQSLPQKALHRLASRLCSNRNAFEQRRECLLKMVASPKVRMSLKYCVVRKVLGHFEYNGLLSEINIIFNLNKYNMC